MTSNRLLLTLPFALVLMLTVASTLWAVTTVAGSINIAAAENGGFIKAFSSEAHNADGSEMPQWKVTNLIDGKHVVGSFVPEDSYGWASATPPSETDPQWIVFAFKGERTHLIGRVVIDPVTDSPSIIGRWVRDVEIQVSNTTANGPYKTVRKVLVVNKPIQQAFDFPAPVEARYVRLVITSNHGSDLRVEMGEVEIYEAIVPDSILDQMIISLTNILEDLKKYRDGQLYRRERETLQQVTAPPSVPTGSASSSGETEPETTPEQPGSATGTSAEESAPAGTVLSVNNFKIVVPEGWERAPQLENPDEGLVLVLVGPAINQTPLVFTVAQRPASDLEATTKLYRHLWEEAKQVSQTEGQALGGPARILKFDRGNISEQLWLLCKNGTGYCLRAAMPQDAKSQATGLMNPLFASFDVAK